MCVDMWPLSPELMMMGSGASLAASRGEQASPEESFLTTTRARDSEELRLQPPAMTPSEVSKVLSRFMSSADSVGISGVAMAADVAAEVGGTPTGAAVQDIQPLAAPTQPAPARPVVPQPVPQAEELLQLLNQRGRPGQLQQQQPSELDSAVSLLMTVDDSAEVLAQQQAQKNEQEQIRQKLKKAEDVRQQKSARVLHQHRDMARQYQVKAEAAQRNLALQTEISRQEPTTGSADNVTMVAAQPSVHEPIDKHAGLVPPRQQHEMAQQQISAGAAQRSLLLPTPTVMLTSTNKPAEPPAIITVQAAAVEPVEDTRIDKLQQQFNEMQRVLVGGVVGTGSRVSVSGARQTASIKCPARHRPVRHETAEAGWGCSVCCRGALPAGSVMSACSTNILVLGSHDVNVMTSKLKCR